MRKGIAEGRSVAVRNGVRVLGTYREELLQRRWQASRYYGARRKEKAREEEERN